jgi:hypothetical protein
MESWQERLTEIENMQLAEVGCHQSTSPDLTLPVIPKFNTKKQQNHTTVKERQLGISDEQQRSVQRLHQRHKRLSPKGKNDLFTSTVVNEEALESI